MNVNFGLFPPLEKRVRGKKMRNRLLSERALLELQAFIEENDIVPQEILC